MDADVVEEEISSEVERQAGVSVTVDCPDDIAVEPGRGFKCLVEGDGERAFANVTIQNDADVFVWEIPPF
jgi:hypothetical protein